MASRYWVGGTASWDGTAGSKWSATSGGGGGASVPTTADDVFFDGSSSGTCTIASGNTGAQSINCTGFTGTITGSASITVAGSITLVSGMTYSHTGTVTFTGTGTLTTAGKTFSAVTVNGSGITLTLGDALNIGSRTVTVIRGTLDTANYNITAGFLFSSDTTYTRTITLGSSTVTLTGAAPAVLFIASNLTFNAGTSQINISNTQAELYGAGQTFYNVSFTATANITNGIRGQNTFNNLTFSAPSSNEVGKLFIAANQTVNGTLTCAGASRFRRCFIRSDIVGTSRTITAAAVSADNCDFRDITIAGAAAPISPTGAGDCGGNSGITFPAGQTVYRVGSSTTWTGSSSWATSSGGAGSDNNFPLAQDAVVIDDNATPAGDLVTGVGYNIGSMDASARTTAMTLNHAGQITYYGSYTLGSGITVFGSANQTFSGRSTMVFTSAGKTITFVIYLNAPPGVSLQLGGDTTTTQDITQEQGTFNANNYNVTCSSFSAFYGNTRTLTMGSGLWTLTGTGTVWNVNSTNLTFNKDTANILLSSTSSSDRTFSGGGLTYNKLTIGGSTGTSTLNLGGTNTFSELASTKTVAHTINFVDAQTVQAWTITGTAGNVVTLTSSTPTNLIKTGSGIVSVDYLTIVNSSASPANTWYAGLNSVDSGGNSGWIFGTPTNGSFMVFFT